MRTISFGLVCLCCSLLVGCGGGSDFDIVPVSGKVTLDGQPLADAVVTFMPQATGSDRDAGPTSWARTDAQGMYELVTATEDETSGAVAGTHQVMITTAEEPQGDDERDDVYGSSTPERVPSRYNSATQLTIDVPAEGTDAANWELTSGR